MSPTAIWGVAILLYVGFRAWYDNWRGPLSAAEISMYMARIEGTSTAEMNDVDALRRFLEEDDGREFAMLNLVRLHPEPVAHPVTGEPVGARQLLLGYLRGFVPALVRRGGVPLLQARKIGPYVDAWGSESDPGWSIVGYMRYRSRRDLISTATDPRFLEIHPLKIAAISNTFSFPTRPGGGAFLGPRIWVALALALCASLVQLAIS